MTSFGVHDERSFVEALKACDPKMRNLAWRLVQHDTDDVLQEAYLKAHRKLNSFSGDADAFVAWLYRITYNTCIDHLRSLKRDKRLIDSVLVEPELDRSVANAVVTREIVREAIKQIRPEWAAAVVLVDLEGMSYELAADALGMRVGTVSTHVNRGRSRLRQLLYQERTQ